AASGAAGTADSRMTDACIEDLLSYDDAATDRPTAVRGCQPAESPWLRQRSRDPPMGLPVASLDGVPFDGRHGDAWPRSTGVDRRRDGMPRVAELIPRCRARCRRDGRRSP